MVSHEVGGDIYEVGGDIVTPGPKAKRRNPVSAWEDSDPPEKKQTQRPSEVPEAKTPLYSLYKISSRTSTIGNAGKKNLGDWLIDRFNIGSQPAGAFQEHEDAPPPETKAKYEDSQEGTQPTETNARYEDSRV